MYPFVSEDISQYPEEIQALYTKKGDKFEVSGITGVQTQANIDRLERSLDAARNDAREAKAKLNNWTSMGDDPTKIQNELDKIAEYKAASEVTEDNFAQKVEEMVGIRLGRETNPLTREINTLKTSNQEMLQKIQSFQEQEQKRTIKDSISSAIESAKIRNEARQDALLLGMNILTVEEDGSILTKSNDFGIPEGLSPDVLFGQELREKRSLWWEESVGGNNPRGGGGGGGFAQNPWSAKNWNLTEQGQVITQKGEQVAEQMAKAAGTTIGGGPPASK